MIYYIGLPVVYFIGFVIAGALEERYCSERATGHEYRTTYETHKCNHPWETFLVPLWPLAVAFGAVILPIWLVFGGAGKLSHKLAELPTREERRLEREKTERRLKQEADIERKAMKRRIRELEAEVLEKDQVA